MLSSVALVSLCGKLGLAMTAERVETEASAQKAI